MKFNKQQLNFLEVFSQFISNKVDFICIDYNKDDKFIYFSQFSNILLIYKFPVPKEINLPSFNYIYSTSMFRSLINLLNTNDVVELKKEGILINGESFYNIGLDIQQKNKYENILNTLQNESYNTYFLNDLEKINFVKFFVGLDKLNVIGLFNSYFITSNRIKILSGVKTNNSSDIKLYIPFEFVFIFNFFKINKINLKVTSKFIFFNYENLTVIYPLKEYILPNIFEDKYSKMIDYPCNININRESFLSKLKRLSIYMKHIYGSELFISFEQNKIILEIKDFIRNLKIAKEIVNFQEENNLKELNGKTFIVSLDTFINSLNIMKEEIFTLSLNPDPNSISIMVKEKDKFYIHILYKTRNTTKE